MIFAPEFPLLLLAEGGVVDLGAEVEVEGIVLQIVVNRKTLTDGFPESVSFSNRVLDQAAFMLDRGWVQSRLALVPYNNFLKVAIVFVTVDDLFLVSLLSFTNNSLKTVMLLQAFIRFSKRVIPG